LGNNRSLGVDKKPSSLRKKDDTCDRATSEITGKQEWESQWIYKAFEDLSRELSNIYRAFEDLARELSNILARRTKQHLQNKTIRDL